ncbi:MAG: response regulator [Burkholderiales bacterium]
MKDKSAPHNLSGATETAWAASTPAALEGWTTTGQAGVLRQQAETLMRRKTDAAGDQSYKMRAITAPLTLPDAAKLLHDLQVHQIELELQNEELRRAQDALETSRARYFDLYDLAPVGYFTLDKTGLILEANLTAATLLGVARSTFTGRLLSHYIAPDDADTYYLSRRQLLKSGATQAFELRFLRVGKAPFTAWVEVSMHGTDDESVCQVALSDISELKSTQDKLRQSQSLLQIAGRVAQMGGWTLQLPGHELQWSREIFDLLEFPQGTLLTLTQALALYTPASHEIISNALRACARTGTPFDCELEIYTAKRRALNVRAIGQAVRDEHGSIIAIEGAFQNISEHKKAAQTLTSLETQLRESQKMEAIGTLAGGIAHDFNNILGTMLGNAELARQDCGSNWQALVSLDEIQKAGHRAKDLVQQILTFSQRQPTARHVMSLPALVEESVRLMRAVLPGGVRIDYQCAADTPPVTANATQIKQVLLNLGTNAAHAMQARPGSIEIRVDAFLLDATAGRADLNLRPGRYARIVVIDTGAGMDTATQRRVFEPFFTTKPAGQGTGLGLAVVHGIMQTHEGAIALHSEPGKGTRFELYFPSTYQTPASAPTETAGPASEGHGQHILYIDDDESQLFLIKRMLERWGYRVSAYLEQREALAVVRAGEINFDLVITDFKMPGLSGLEVTREIQSARPALPVIMVSGYITQTLRQEAAAAGVRELIAKPHNMEELRDLIYHFLASNRITGEDVA